MRFDQWGSTKIISTRRLTRYLSRWIGWSAREKWIRHLFTLPASETSAFALRSIRPTVNRLFNKIESPVYTSVCSADSEAKNLKIGDRLTVENSSDTWSSSPSVDLLVPVDWWCPSSLIAWNVLSIISLIFTRANFFVTFPSVTSICFYAGVPLNLKLMITVKHVACSRLWRVPFKIICLFHNDLNEDTRLTLPTVERLHLCDLGTSEDRSCRRRRLFCLTPHLDRWTFDWENLLQMIDAVKCQE